MPNLQFAKAFRRHVDCPAAEVPGTTVGEALAAYFADHPLVRGYVVDERGAVRRHIAVFVNAQQIDDREDLEVAVAAGDTIHVFQALSGG